MKLGICLPDFGFSQLVYHVVKNTNEYVTTHTDLSIIGFYENIAPLYMRTNFPIMHSFEMFNYDGIIISTNLDTAEKSLKSFHPLDRFFYVWDLEWIRQPKKNFNYISNIYRNPNIKLLARSLDHKEMIEKCWNVNVFGIVENFNYEQIIPVIARR